MQKKCSNVSRKLALPPHHMLAWGDVCPHLDRHVTSMDTYCIDQMSAEQPVFVVPQNGWKTRWNYFTCASFSSI